MRNKALLLLVIGITLMASGLLLGADTVYSVDGDHPFDFSKIINPTQTTLKDGQSKEKTEYFEASARLELYISLGDVSIRPSEDEKIKIVYPISDGKTWQQRLISSSDNHRTSLRLESTPSEDIGNVPTTELYLPQSVRELSVESSLGSIDLSEIHDVKVDLNLSLGEIELANTKVSGSIFSSMGSAQLNQVVCQNVVIIFPWVISQEMLSFWEQAPSNSLWAKWIYS